jgi:hypothetical protein
VLHEPAATLVIGSVGHVETEARGLDVWRLICDAERDDDPFLGTSRAG